MTDARKVTPRNITIGDVSYDLSKDEFGGIGKVRCTVHLVKMSHNTMADTGFIAILLPLLGQKVTDPESKREFEIKEEDGAINTFLKLGPMTAGTLNALNAMGWKEVKDKNVTGEDFEDFAQGLTGAEMDLSKVVDVTLEVNSFTSGGKNYSNIRVKYINPVDLSIKPETAKTETEKYKQMIKDSKKGPLKMEKKKTEAGATPAPGGNVSSGGASQNSSGAVTPPARDAAPAEGDKPANDIPF